MTRCILINTTKFGKHSIKSKKAVEAGSGPRHLTFSGGMFILQELTGGLMVFPIRKES
jgi:6-phosphogluconolactonase (cycloisomerase 2 family)